MEIKQKVLLGLKIMVTEDLSLECRNFMENGHFLQQKQISKVKILLCAKNGQRNLLRYVLKIIEENDENIVNNSTWLVANGHS